MGRTGEAATVVLAVVLCSCWLSCYLVKAVAVTVSVHVNTSVILNRVDDAFISFNIDSNEFDEDFELYNFSSKRLLTLVSALSPSLLRVGGSAASWLFFDKDSSVVKRLGLQPEPIVASKQYISELVGFARSANCRLLFDLNLQQRYGQQWDPSNAVELLEFLANHGYGESIDWELGNEPEYITAGQLQLSAEQIGKDFLVLNKLLKSYPNFSQSRIVGPDVVGIGTEPEALNILQAVVNSSGNFLRAATFHHYYFRGDTATYEDYLDPKYFGSLSLTIDLVKSAIAQSKYPNTSVWIGETSDAWHGGTSNVSDRFVSSFLWLDKLGVSAQKGIGVVMRQTLFGHNNYSMLDLNMHPNPDYWTSALHRWLVGRTVLNVSISTAPESTRVYAHCSSTRYQDGAITLFALNTDRAATTRLVFKDSFLRDQSFDIYMLSPQNGILSKTVLLNGQQILKMPSDTEMPLYKPVHLPPGSEVDLLPLTIGFFVFPYASVKICLNA